MLEEFSGGYYRARMTVQPFDEGPIIERGLYNLINRQLYAQTNAPVTMRLGLDAAPSFQPSSENGVPPDVLAAPTELLDDSGVHPSAEEVNVFIYKPEAAYLFSESMRLGNSRKGDTDD